MKQLILGGARSGKSRLAENLAANTSKTVVYVATSEALDGEMKARIAQHQADRPAAWQTVEEPIALSEVLKRFDDEKVCLLIDCLTLWVTNCLLHKEPECWAQQKQAFLQQLTVLKADVILVSNEVGQGIVPLGEINRQFVDETGWLHQAVAKACNKVVFVVAGLPQVLKS